MPIREDSFYHVVLIFVLINKKVSRNEYKLHEFELQTMDIVFRYLDMQPNDTLKVNLFFKIGCLHLPNYYTFT